MEAERKSSKGTISNLQDQVRNDIKNVTNCSLSLEGRVRYFCNRESLSREFIHVVVKILHNLRNAILLTFHSEIVFVFLFAD